MGRWSIFQELLQALAGRDVRFVRMDALAGERRASGTPIPVHDLVMQPIDGRSGLVATQGPVFPDSASVA
jgi:undecaprenyl phosphate-alpha-L-ara4FN deformylase